MTIIYSGIECAICNQVISDDLLDKGEFVATSAFIGDTAHHLWRFSDATMHKHCFLNWEHRQEFVQLYNDMAWGNGRPHHMSDDGEVTEVTSFKS